MSPAIIQQISVRRLKESQYLKANVTKGGILLVWNPTKFKLVNCEKKRFMLSITLNHNGPDLKILGVYGPTTPALRRYFFLEIQQIKSTNDIPWLLCGDFNVTLLQEDINNPNAANWRESIKFSNLIMDVDLINLPLRGKNYTWSNFRLQPIMERLDRFLISPSWSSSFLN